MKKNYKLNFIINLIYFSFYFVNFHGLKQTRTKKMEEQVNPGAVLQAALVLQRVARRMNAQNQMRSLASQAKAEKSGIECDAEEAKSCSCCRSTIREGLAFDHNMTLPSWRPSRKQNGTELTSLVLSVGDEKSGGTKEFNGVKFPSWSEAINRFVNIVIPFLERKLGSDLYLDAPKLSLDDSVASVLDDIINTIECQQAKEKLIEKVRKFIHQQFHMEFLLGTCITRRGGHFIAPNEISLRYLLDQALEFARTKKVDQKNQRPFVFLEETPLLPLGKYPTRKQLYEGTILPMTVNVRVRCMKDHNTKPCNKYITLSRMADNLRRIAAIMGGVFFPEHLNRMNPFCDVIDEFIRFADIIESKILEIANALNPRAVAFCPGTHCKPIQRPMKPQMIKAIFLSWGWDNIHDCEQCGICFCCNCGAEIAGNKKNHVCNTMHHFEALPQETKDKIKKELGRNYQFCPECKTVAEHGLAGEDRGCDKLSCPECKTGFCVRCGEKVNRSTYFGEHMIAIGPEIFCRFSVVYEGATIPSKPYDSMFGFRNHSEIRREVLSMISNGNKKVLTDLVRIARERELYPNAIHPEVKEALKRVKNLHLSITPKEQTILFRE